MNQHAAYLPDDSLAAPAIMVNAVERVTEPKGITSLSNSDFLSRTSVPTSVVPFRRLSGRDEQHQRCNGRVRKFSCDSQQRPPSSDGSRRLSFSDTPSSYVASRHNSVASRRNSTVSRQNSFGSRPNSLGSRQSSFRSRNNSIGSRYYAIGSRQNSVGSRRNSVTSRQNSFRCSRQSSLRRQVGCCCLFFCLIECFVSQHRLSVDNHITRMSAFLYKTLLTIICN